MFPVRTSTILFAAASTALLALTWRSAAPAPQFVWEPTGALAPEPPLWESRFIPQPASAKHVHSATMATLPKGDRLAVWWAGSAEAARDVLLFQAAFQGGRWHEPRPIMSPEEAGRAERRYTRRVGNPSMFRDSLGRLRLFFVSVAVGGWAGSSINQMVSHDDGQAWSPPKRIVTSPLFNLSTLVRNPPIPLADGGFYLPAYHETIRKFPELLQFDRDGRLVNRIRTADRHGSLQPALVPVSADRALCFLRDRCFLNGRVLCQETGDGGQNWTPPAGLDLTNPDTPVAAGRFADGTFVLVHNPGPARQTLVLSASRDGKNWRQLCTLEAGPGEYSYPTLVIEGSRLDLVYTWKRQSIRHIRTNTAWIKERLHG